MPGGSPCPAYRVRRAGSNCCRPGRWWAVDGFTIVKVGLEPAEEQVKEKRPRVARATVRLALGSAERITDAGLAPAPRSMRRAAVGDETLADRL